jgi:superoxide dismutase, Cu-Zn family
MKMISAVIGAAVLTGCQLFPTSTDGAQARASLEPKSGSAVAGQIDFRETGGQILVTVKVSGLKPNSEHGFHVHEKGDCSAADATSAGGHFNPDGAPHGHHGQGNRHAGDMPNLVANGKGEASTSFKISQMRLDNKKYGILNRAVVIHANPDDYKSQPAGNAGARIACGVIKKA